MKTKLLAFFLFTIAFTVNAQTTYTYNGSGNWSNTANWSPSYPGTTITANAIVTGNGGTVTLDQELSVSANVTLTFASGAFWVHPSSGLIDHGISGHWIIGTNTSMTFTNSRVFTSISGRFTNNGTLNANELIVGNQGLFTNNGTLNLNGGNACRFNMNGANARLINNTTGVINNFARIASTGSVGLDQNVYTNYGTWINNNNFNILTSVSVRGTIHNYGSMTFSNNAVWKNNGNWINYAGSQLNMNTGSSLENTTSSMIFNDGASFTANTVTITNNAPMTQNAGATFQVSGTSTFDNNNNLSIYGAASFGGGVNFTNSASGELDILNDNSNPTFGLTSNAIITNNGIIDNQGRFNVNNLINQNNVFENKLTAELNLNNVLTNSAAFTNEANATINITGAGNLTNSATFNNFGTIHNEATIQETSLMNFEPTGTLTGTGTHFQNSTNNGTISPGTDTNTFATYSYQNDLTTNSTTTFDIDISGTATGFVNDRIDIAGFFVIAGTLNVNLPFGTTPSYGETFTLFTYTDHLNTFSNVNLPALPFGQQWNVDYGATVFTLTVGCSFSSSRIYVNTNATGANTGESWTDAFTSLQDAIDLSNNCTIPEIWVAQGTYYPSAHPRDVTSGTLTDRDFTFHLVDGTKMYGGFTGTETTLSERDFINNPTILSGDIGVQGDMSDNTYHVVSSLNDANTTILDGFSVENGVGGTTFSGITAEGQTIEVFAGGGIINKNTATTYENLIIQNNQSITGGGMYNDTSNITANNIVLIHNSTASDGGAMSFLGFSSPVFNNLLIANNTSFNSGAISHFQATPIYNNATFYNNVSTNSSNPHVISNFSSIPTFNNCVTFGQPFDFSFTSGGNVQGSNNYTSQNPTEYGSPAGFTHLTVDPFVNSSDIDGADNILRTADDGLVGLYNSVLHQAGNNTFATLPTDITGQPRIVETTVDIGAYEQQNTVTVTYFVTTWKTDNTGSSNDNQITIPTRGGFTYNYDIDWENDGTFDDFGVTGDITHTYASAGTYTVAIRGTFPAILFNGGGDNEKILSIEQWGTIAWKNFDRAFSGCINLVENSIDTPNLTNVFDMGFAFSGCTAFNQDINDWNVSSVQRFRGMFSVSGFNQPLNNWNIDSAKDMSSMFSNSPFNQPLSNWDLIGVESIQSMFRGTPFDQDISMWDTSTIEFMGQLFFGCPFNQDISGWNTGNVKNMLEMFKSNLFFDQDIGGWNVSNVLTMRGMFQNTTFDKDISQWNVSMVSDMLFMFQGGNLSTENYDALLMAWSQLTLKDDVYFSVGNSAYCYGTQARADIEMNFNWTFDDGGQGNCPVLLSPKVYLQGAYINPNTGEETLMRDDLRVAGLIPITSPYADMLTCDASVFNTVGNDAIVDWVWVELRDATDNTNVITSQSALLQRDGDIVDVDGEGELLMNASIGDYYVVVKHRNHLGVMSANTLPMDYTSTSINFSNPTTQTFGTNAQIPADTPTDIIGLWAGNANGDHIVQYSGTDPDSPSILSIVLNDSGNFLNFPTFIVNSYSNADTDMDGNAQYSGTNPDTPFILQNVLAHPGNFLNFSTYQIIEQLPEN
ncbi:BspA family leucine-rich repeat surface protein [Kordia jejudonensis]|uniref:BspA family leucine-rich repeat surface protein n=1 Tax=Kordia jejudonensis TaxID=1348245 RepID=UPI0006996DBE|nr:BspA family leucine-rich repeat surface protein [Kordia jejudonensis]